MLSLLRDSGRDAEGMVRAAHRLDPGERDVSLDGGECGGIAAAVTCVTSRRDHCRAGGEENAEQEQDLSVHVFRRREESPSAQLTAIEWSEIDVAHSCALTRFALTCELLPSEHFFA
ncbi:MAG: hypothetical protein ABI680_07775 [Chthoniobacteraceae bacterium]